MKNSTTRQKNELKRRRREMLKLSASLFAVGVISGGLGIGSAYLLTGGTQLEDSPKPKRVLAEK